MVGIFVGIGIGAVLGAAEGVLVRSIAIAKRGALVGLAVGIGGGLLGSAFAQGFFSLTGGGGSDVQAEGKGGGSSVFSTQIQKRLKEAGAREGEIEVALSWENRNDLDLLVVDPNGDIVSHRKRVVASGGELDVDRNAACSHDMTGKPVEHVVWDNGRAVKGTYKVLVDHYANCRATDPTKFHVEVIVGKNSVGSFDKSISYRQSPVEVATFEYPNTKTAPAVAASGGIIGALLARVIGWLVFGALVGCAEGVRRRSKTALRNAALGGALGGAVGGFLFWLITQIGIGGLGARFLGFVILGACIGLWIVIIEQALSAVLAVRSGRLEGRRIILDKPEMRLGRNDMLEVYLGGDPTILAHHATIRTEGCNHVLFPEDGEVLIGNNPIQGQHVLSDGETMTFGKTRLAYSRRGAGGFTADDATSQAPTRLAPAPPGGAPPLATPQKTTPTPIAVVGEVASAPPQPPPKPSSSKKPASQGASPPSAPRSPLSPPPKPSNAGGTIRPVPPPPGEQKTSLPPPPHPK
jgi:hypothetical protein